MSERSLPPSAAEISRVPNPVVQSGAGEDQLAPLAPASAPAPAPASGRKMWLVAAIAVAVVICLAALAYVWIRSRQPKSAAVAVRQPAGPSPTGPVNCDASACLVAPDCQGVDCAPPQEACVEDPCFNGVRGAAEAVRVVMPEGRVLFSYPFQHRRLRVTGGFLGADEDHLRLTPGIGSPGEYWSFDGTRLANDATGMVLARQGEMSLVYTEADPRDPDQEWLFDGRQFFWRPHLFRRKYHRIGYNPGQMYPMLNEVEASVLYRPGTYPVTVEGYTPPYEF